MKFWGPIAALAALCACDYVKDEVYSPGGFAAVQMDRSLQAVTLQEHADRYLIALSFVGPMAFHSSSDVESLEDVSDHVGDVMKSISEMRKALSGCAYSSGENASFVCDVNADGNVDAADEIGDTVFVFETRSLKVQKDFFRLSSDLANNLGAQVDLSSGDLTDLLSLAKFLWGLRDLLGPAQAAAASFRDAVHIYARNAGIYCGGANEGSCRSLTKELSALYLEGARQPQPTIAGEETSDRRLRKLLLLSGAVLEDGKSNGGGAGFLADGMIEVMVKRLKFACQSNKDKFAQNGKVDCEAIVLTH